MKNKILEKLKEELGEYKGNIEDKNIFLKN
jgi:hypothetical protein